MILQQSFYSLHIVIHTYTSTVQFCFAHCDSLIPIFTHLSLTIFRKSTFKTSCCESHAETLIRAHFWPETPEKTTIGFHVKLMDLAVVLFLHNQVPLKDFAEMILEVVPKLQPILVSAYSI